MTLSARLHCPRCQGRLVIESGAAARCSECETAFPVMEGVADLTGGADVGAHGPPGFSAETLLGAELPTWARRAAGDRWPDKLGDVIVFGCQPGQIADALAAEGRFRSLLVVDPDGRGLRDCRRRLHDAGFGTGSGPPIEYAAISDGQNAIRDAVADTVIGFGVLASVGDVRGFLRHVHRVLKPSGRAVFAVGNRRYWQALLLAVAEALVHRHARDGAWPEDSWPLMTRLASTRRLLVGLDNAGSPDRVFDADAIGPMAAEVGFASAEVLPLKPDPAGAATIERCCLDAGAAEPFAMELGCSAAIAGRPFLGLLGARDASAFSLLWLGKAGGPTVRFQTARPPEPTISYPNPELALGGTPPRWSIELLGQETDDGIVLTVGGWCLANVDVVAVRIVLDEAERDAPVWCYRPDVHDVMNRQRLFHAVNALFSGLDSELVFAGARAVDRACRLRIHIVLAGGVTLSGPGPDRLVMDEPMVVTH
jgi:SAM-dependent methyltransferase